MLKKFKNIYLVGIKGVGMTALAEILQKKGKLVSGSDIKEKFFTDKILQNLQINFEEGFSAKNISRLSKDKDLIIYSTAYNLNSHPELKAAKKRKINLLSYPEAVSSLFNDLYGIAVSGTHGKTTTSALLAQGLLKTGLDPVALIGSKVNEWGGNALAGQNSLFVIEADEYQDKLKFYHPWSIILTNVDYDHPDYYLTEEAYFQSFVRFVEKWLKQKNRWPKIIVLNGDDRKTLNLIKKTGLVKKKNIFLGIYGRQNKLKKNQCWFLKITGDNQNNFFELTLPKEQLNFPHKNPLKIRIKTKLIGEHNLYNLAGATLYLVILLFTLRKNNFLRQVGNQKLKIWLKKIIRQESDQERWLDELAKMGERAFANFSGTERRLQYKGKKGKVAVFDDYAHHPAEIQATLEAVKQAFPKKEIWVIFHPHTFSRTETFLSDFGRSLAKADKIGVLEVYSSAREKQGKVTSRDIVELIQKRKRSVSYLKNQVAAVTWLKKFSLQKPAVLLTMGAGDCWRVGEEWLKK